VSAPSDHRDGAGRADEPHGALKLRRRDGELQRAPRIRDVSLNHPISAIEKDGHVWERPVIASGDQHMAAAGKLLHHHASQ